MTGSSRWLTAALAVALLIFLIVGVWFYRSQEQRLRQETEAQLAAIAELKAGEIAKWRTERLNDAAMLAESPFFFEAVAQWMAAPQLHTADHLLTCFRSLQHHHDYRDVLLVEAQGEVRLSLSGVLGRIDQSEALALGEALRGGKPVISDLRASPGDLPPHLDVIAPLLTPDRKSREPLGAVILQCDARQFLFPLVQSWPTPTRTAETLLVRRDGDAVLFLNDLRHQPDTALKLRIPLNRDDVPAVMAVKGQEGIFQGYDYRGVEVLSVPKAIPDSPWFMVAKVDVAEALAVWRLESALVLAVIYLVAILAVVAVLAAWQRSKAHWRALFAAETAERRANEQYRVTLMSIGDGVVVTDAQGRVQLLNPVAESLTGWTDEEARGQSLETVFRIVNEETRDTVENPIWRVVREGVVVGLANHTALIARDGYDRPIADSGAPIHGEDGQVVGAVLVFRDQTAERAAARTLRETEQRFRDLADLLPQTIYEVDLEGCLTFVNRQALETFGYTRADVESGLNCLQLLAPHERDRAQENIQRALRGEDLGGTEYTGQRKDGTEFPVAIYSSPILREDKPIGLRGIIVDFTEYKRAAEALREEKNYTESIVRSMADMLVVVSPDDTITTVNEATCRLSGYSRQDLIGRSATLLFEEETIPHVLSQHPLPVKRTVLRRLVKEGSVSNVEKSLRTKAGDRIPVLLSGAIMRDDGNTIRGIVCLALDITEQKELESEREITIQLLRLINETNSRHELLRLVTALLHQWSGCKSVGIRLRDGEDFPYFETRGFPPEFVLAENRLCEVDSRGELKRDSTGNPVLECMCGNVICGRFDPGKPFFTAHGSFWTNCTTELLASTTEANRQGRTRNRCNGEGYESVALIPLRASGETFGLLQLNDHRKGRFTPRGISLLERLADSVAIGLAHRAAQESLRENALRLERTAKAGNVGLWDWDLRTNRVFYSSEWKRQIGYEDQEIGGDYSEWQDRIHPDDLDRCLQTVTAFIARPWPDYRLEFRFRHKDGSYRWILAQASLAFDEQGTPIRMLGSHIDITDRKATEDSLLREAAMRSLLLENLPCIAMVLRKGTREIVYANEPASQLGASPGKTCYCSCARRDNPCPFCHAAEVWATDKPRRLEVEYQGKWYEARWVPLSDELYVHFIFDITERKLAEEALRQSEKMQAEAEKLAATGRMAARVAHEINNPLAGIRNAFQLVRDAVPEEHPDRDMVERIDREITRISNIVQQIYTLYSPRADQITETVVAHVVQDVLSMLEPMRREWEVQFDATGASSGLSVCVPEGGLHQIVFNLLTNAVEASPSGGVVTIAVALDESRPDMVRISVRDQGKGIPPDIQPKIFEPFFTSKTDEYMKGGLGLGLSVVRTVVEASGGRIEFDSTTGQGTTFCVFLPSYVKALER